MRKMQKNLPELKCIEIPPEVSLRRRVTAFVLQRFQLQKSSKGKPRGHMLSSHPDPSLKKIHKCSKCGNTNYEFP